jgi:hypothetical protein
MKDKAALYMASDADAKADFDALAEAHSLLCYALMTFRPYVGWNLCRMKRSRDAYAKLERITDYLFDRGEEILLLRRTCP